MARLRCTMGVDSAGTARSLLTSAEVRAFGSVRPLLGRSTEKNGLKSTTFSSVRKIKKVFRAEMRLALVRCDILFCRAVSR